MSDASVPGVTPAQTMAQRWVAGRGRWARLGLAILAGALMTAGHAPVSVPWALFLAVPAIVLLVVHAPDVRAAAWIGWGAGFGYFVTGLHWIGHAFLVDPDRFAWLMPLGVTLLPAGLALFWALAFAIAKRLAPPGPVVTALILALVWALAEYARGHVLTGFPWALPGYVWVDTPAVQAAAWIGPYGLTLLTLAVTALPGLAIAARRPLAGGLALALGIAVWMAGAARVPDTDPQAAPPDAPVIRLVQPNAPQNLKWKQGYREEFYRRTVEATAAPPDPELGRPIIVVWPETAVFFVPAAEPREVANIAWAAGGATVLLGALHHESDGNGGRWSNAMVSILPDGRLGPRYDKHHLVPFGEYLPLQGFFDLFGLSQFANRGDFHRGDGPTTVRIPGLPSFSPLICYEAIFPHKIVSDDRPEWLVQPTNDAWFGSFAGPQQHYAQARIRAIEQGLPMVRAANTGISAIVDSYGREVVSMDLHTHGYVDAKLPASLAPTLYSLHGATAFLFLIVVYGLFSLSLCFLSRNH